MRIIAGEWRRRQLVAPEGRTTRPPTDFIRENIFNILSDAPIDARVLDLFAGCGSLGLEALSRGAVSCTFVERDAGALRSLRRNVKTLEAGKRCSLVRGDVFRVVKSLAREKRAFDLVFCDPPFLFAESPEDAAKVAGALKSFLETPLLADGGVIVLRARKRAPYTPMLPAPPDETRLYGESAVIFFRR